MLSAEGRLSWTWVSEAFGEEWSGKNWHQLPGGMVVSKEDMVVDIYLDAQFLLIRRVDEVEEECLGGVVCCGYAG